MAQNPSTTTSKPTENVKTALVTGAARRLGKAIALSLAKQGWDIILHYHQSEKPAKETAKQIRALNRQCFLIQADLAKAGAAPLLFKQALSHVKSIDLLVNNASLFEYDSANDFNAKQLKAHLGPNLIAPLELAQSFSHQQRFSPAVCHGVIIHLLDQKLWNLNPDFFSYTLCKAALQAAVTMQAQALAPKIRVMGLAPGLTLPSHMQDQADFERTHKMAPLGQASTPQDISQTVLYIANTPSLTGHTIIVDGGQHLVGFERDFSLL